MPYRFYPSEARKLAEKIIAEELTGKEYDEDDAKDLSLTICERIKNGVKSKYPNPVPKRAMCIYVTVCWLMLRAGRCRPLLNAACTACVSSIEVPPLQGSGASDAWADAGPGGEGGVALPVGHGP